VTAGGAGAAWRTTLIAVATAFLLL
jgi:hypothetical protein